MGAREYYPLIGKFISADIIVPQPGNPQSLNRYSYANNRPLNLVDPSGHCATTPTGQQICDSSSSTLSTALVVAPMALTVQTTGSTNQLSQEGKNNDGVIRPNPEDVTTGLFTHYPGGALSLVAPYAVAVAPYAVSAVGVVASTAAINAASRCLLSSACERALNLVNGYNNGLSPNVTEDQAEQIARSATVNAGSGYVSLGHYPQYVVSSQLEGMTHLQMSNATWNSLNTAGRWLVNKAFLDQAIARGDKFVLTTDVEKYSFFAEEIQYLINSGYKLVNGMLVK